MEVRALLALVEDCWLTGAAERGGVRRRRTTTSAESGEVVEQTMAAESREEE